MKRPARIDRELLRETDAAWINLAPGLPQWLKDGSGFLWLTERTGEWSLELRSPQGKLGAHADSAKASA